MNTKIIISIIALLGVLSLPSIVLASASDTVTINVNVSVYALIEVSPKTATFNQVTPGYEPDIPDSLAFTITNVGSVNFTQMYVAVNVPGSEQTNPLGTGDVSKYFAGGFVVLKNETDLTTGKWKFVGRQEWNLTDGKPEDYKGHESTWAQAWGYFGNVSRQYFWELVNGTNGLCNGTSAVLNMKNYAVNGTADAYVPNSGDYTPYTVDNTDNPDWGIINAENNGPLANYCIALRTDCTRIFIYQWKQGDSQLDSCTGYWYLYDGPNEFAPNNQFDFNITVWVPKGIPAGDTSPSTLTITATP